MFICTCGGILLVQEIEQIPKALGKYGELDYKRKCTVKCQECGEIKINQPYD